MCFSLRDRSYLETEIYVVYSERFMAWTVKLGVTFDPFVFGSETNMWAVIGSFITC